MAVDRLLVVAINGVMEYLIDNCCRSSTVYDPKCAPKLRQIAAAPLPKRQRCTYTGPQLKVLAASRERLRLADETTYIVPTLTCRSRIWPSCYRR